MCHIYYMHAAASKITIQKIQNCMQIFHISGFNTLINKKALKKKTGKPRLELIN